MTTVDELAQVIREVDGKNSLGAGALAEAIIAKLPHIAARQPVGEPRAALWIQFAENGNIRFWTKDQDRALAESFLHARPLTAFYASPQQPAQAVDLDQFRPAVLSYWSECKRRQTAAVGGPAAQQNAAAEQVKGAERLLDLIDSKAVGNG